LRESAFRGSVAFGAASMIKGNNCKDSGKNFYDGRQQERMRGKRCENGRNIYFGPPKKVGTPLAIYQPVKLTSKAFN
jgi:hypothetical protein